MSRAAVLVSFVVSATSCAMVPTAAERAAALQEPVWNVEPLDPAEWLAERAANPAAWEARYERKVLRFRGRTSHAIAPRGDERWTVFIQTERADLSSSHIACHLDSRERATELPTGTIVLVHGPLDSFAPGIAYSFRDCVIEATGSAVPASVRPDRVTVSPEFREEIRITSRDLDAQLAGEDEALKARLTSHPLIITGRVRSVLQNGRTGLEVSNPLRSLGCDDLERGSVAVGQTVKVRARVRHTGVVGHTLWGCILVR